MARMRGIFLMLIFAPALLHAQGASQTFSSNVERKLDLLGTAPALRDTLPGDVLTGPAAEKKSVGLAAIYSLLVPGMGELYAGNFASGKYFLAAEGGLWLTYAAFEVYGNSLRNDARAFAAARAGASVAGKNDQFFVDLGNFMTTADYNDKKLRDREPDKLYDPAAGYGWAWDSDASRSTFREQRVSSENMYNNRKFVVAAVLVNHVASAINAARAVISHNRALQDALGDLQVGATIMGGIENPHGIMLQFSRSF